ncbi:AbrB family transcriptional regulator [Candidatus Hydrogenisulfobacillus filiaventi]|uniref:AbrB family transcriptional regulator n=1 Tax=Candidatus Hydrogenisulfobacillus filiaventi TaxID=2707344 RepID=A0A6F8ZJF7_9FIRM|nr:AbrB family transcriptional regulator [Candidatus Hydrogenisulfobacillus filiaventi]
MAHHTIVRSVEALGRVTVPIAIRRTLGLSPGSPIEILVGGDVMALRRFVPGCAICGSTVDLRSFKGRPVCARCRTDMPHRLD